MACKLMARLLTRVRCVCAVFDHRNASLQKWLVDEYIGGSEGIGSPHISGIFIDDSWAPNGPSEIDTHANNDTGLSASDVKDMIAGWSGNMVAVQEKIISAGAMNWQLFANGGTLAGPPFPKAQCATYMRETACVANSTLQHVPLLYGIERNSDYPPFKYIVDFEQSLAAFLLVRGPWAWFGYSWISCIGVSSHPLSPS